MPAGTDKNLAAITTGRINPWCARFGLLTLAEDFTYTRNVCRIIFIIQYVIYFLANNMLN